MKKSPVRVSPENKQVAVEDILSRALDAATGRLSPSQAAPLVAAWATRLNVTEGAVRSWIPEEKKATLQEYLAYARTVCSANRREGTQAVEGIDPRTGELNDYDTPPSAQVPEQVNGKLSAHAPEALAELKYEALLTVLKAIKQIPHLYSDVEALRQSIAQTGEDLNQVREEMKVMLDLLGEEAKRRLQETALWIETMERHHNLIPVSQVSEMEEENRMILEENTRLHARLDRMRRLLQGEE